MKKSTSRLIETIRHLNGEFHHLEYHAQRMRRAWRELYNIDEPWSLWDVLKTAKTPGLGIYKCRLLYDTKPIEISFELYQVRPVNSLKMIKDNEILYPHKFTDRRSLDGHFEKRGKCDDVLIVKNGLVTDTTYANIIFKRNGEWFTPLSCLLPGTTRQRLLNQGKIREEEISVDRIKSFESFKLINSMLSDEGPEVSVSNIIN